jgi:ABC-type microcin C transport system duplicated ATPase subunit YejF
LPLRLSGSLESSARLETVDGHELFVCVARFEGGAVVCDRVIVMRAGQIVEQNPSERVLDDPQDAYTRDR